ncbi:MAG: pyridoxal phosphate-dependent aminotransferase [Ignavibacteriales bacterium]|nr:pyridoxal phosphate-dependent aminotransferase [Ignavibacteriales bacterium]
MNDPSELFRFKPVKAAKVSEVSEATASSDIPVEERVNFHIGNPVQDPALSSAYLRMILGIPIENEILQESNTQGLMDALDWKVDEEKNLDLLKELIKKSAPYMPRGGYNSKAPHFLILHFINWLKKDQQEPLAYDLGESSGSREILLSTGGLYESLRLLFHSIENYSVHTGMHIFLYGVKLPLHLCGYKSLSYSTMPDKEDTLTDALEEHFKRAPDAPVYLLLGKLTNEITRRNLRVLSLENPLFFVELNDAPNHLSLAREAKMMNRVLRILSPGIFHKKLQNNPVSFIAGNPDIIKIMETVQFQLKGTPSATEIVMLSFVLQECMHELNADAEVINEIIVKPKPESSPFHDLGDNFVKNTAKKYAARLEDHIIKHSAVSTTIANNFVSRDSAFNRHSAKYVSGLSHDIFSEKSNKELLQGYINNSGNEEWSKELTNSFIHAFLRHHTEYYADACQLVSGSSRTGLGLLGFHCGIKEVVIPDLSWTYEHCFPKVHVVPLKDNLDIDVNGIIEELKKRLSLSPGWNMYGAIALNNPHNATGGEFNQEELKRLIQWALHKNIIIIDDLSYQNVAPRQKLIEIKTLRQLTNELLSSGYVTEEQSNLIVTVHSLSKTDSLAGARLSVIEIRNRKLYEKFQAVNESIIPNSAAVFLTYLFYRNSPESTDAYWRLRNRIFYKRMLAIEEAVEILPKDRNNFDIIIKPPLGSMYPQMIIKKLPDGLSLDWLASGLARQGIGLVPLSTFARTEKGFETARTTFRLTLGGPDDAGVLLHKTRRVLIDLNRLIAEEASNYKRKTYSPVIKIAPIETGDGSLSSWTIVEQKITEYCTQKYRVGITTQNPEILDRDFSLQFKVNYLPERLNSFRLRYKNRLAISLANLRIIQADKGKQLIQNLEKEFFKDSLEQKEKLFNRRLFDRTVHPTQMYSIKVEQIFEKIITLLIREEQVPERTLQQVSSELIHEYNGSNVAIISADEPAELLLDLGSMIAVEDFRQLNANMPMDSLLSFWGDWDGSNRPSGQGHSLIAAVLIENVSRQASLLKLLMTAVPGLTISSTLLLEIEKLSDSTNKFGLLLRQITLLTHQLEKRYKGILPFNMQPGRLRQMGMKLHLARDPLTTLWQHNDRLERKMYELRSQRKAALEYYFDLNKQLRKALHANLPALQKNISYEPLMREAAQFHDLMKRFVVTPRIHQKMVTAQDQFAVDTTVNNIYEINEIAGKYGNPGMVLALQISMSTKPEALITLDRKMRTRREQILRENKNTEIPSVRLIPLFEDSKSVQNVQSYMHKIWEYALQSRRMNQNTEERVAEMMCEIFIAGSDLSQQIGQAPGFSLYKSAKNEITKWLAEKGLTQYIRMKMGSGEPMQRQGGYYFPFSGQPAFVTSSNADVRFSQYLKASTKKSTEYAVTPMMGVHAGGDMRTLQSAISEKLRYLPVETVSQLFYHIQETQKFYRSEVIRAAEPLTETRLHFKTRGMKELERLTIGKKDALYDVFLGILTENFRQILYGRDEDVVGIHIISYFIARTTPPLRDRPLIRPGQGVSGNAGRKILEKIAETIPLSRYGSMLRAIAHNQSQTSVLGICQLTTGLFRALDSFTQLPEIESEAGTIIEDRLLPHLPVYEILHTLRVYHDVELSYLNQMEKAFPAGNSAFLALREDIDAMHKYLIHFQRELLRRHGLNVADFFESGRFIADLLPTLRPDLAILLQPDFFNTNETYFFGKINGLVDEKWKEAINELLNIPEEIKRLRSKTWELLQEPVFQRVSGFVELAIALYSLSSGNQSHDVLLARQKMRLPAEVSNFFKSSNDDNMRQFLAAAFEYLSVLSEGMVEVPTNIIRAIKEVERIIKIEEQALTPKQQELLRFYLLQIARLTGENG